MKHNVQYIKHLLLKENWELLDEYQSVMQKVHVKCLRCSNIWFTYLNHIIYEHRRCPICHPRNARKPMSHMSAVKLLTDKSINLKTIPYKNTRQKLELECMTCKHPWIATMHNILTRDCGCPKCNQPGSKSQKRLEKILKEIFPNYKIYYNFRGFKWLGKQEIDIYIEDIKLAIEYDGKQHYKSSKKFGGKLGFYKTKKRDFAKNEKIANNSQDVTTFIRISYKTLLTKENIQRILSDNQVI